MLNRRRPAHQSVSNFVHLSLKFFEGFQKISGDARHRRLVVLVVCSVETGNQFVKRFQLVFAKKAVPSPFANAFGFAPAVA